MNNDFASKLQEQINKLKNEEDEWETEKSKTQSKITILQQEETQWLQIKDVLLSRLRILRSAANASPTKREEILSQLSSQPSIQSFLDGNIQDQPQNSNQNKIKFNENEENNSDIIKNRSTPVLVSPGMLKKKAGKELKRRKSSNSPKLASPKSSNNSNGVDYNIKCSLSQHLDCVRCVAFHPTLPYIATGSDDGSIRITNLDPPKKAKARNAPQFTQLISLRGHSGAVLSLAAYHNYLISGDVNGQICVWNFSDTKNSLNESYGRIDHHIYYFTDDHTDAVWSIATHENSPYFISSSADKTIRIHNIEAQNSTPIAIPDEPTVVSFNSDASHFIVGCSNGQIKIFNNKQESSKFDLKSYIISICPSSSKNEIYIATEDKNICLFDLNNGTVLKQFVPHELYTSSMALSSDGKYLVTTSPDKTIRIWDSLKLELISVDSHHRNKYGEAGLCIATTPSTNSYDFFASGGADGVVRVFVRNK